MGGQLVLKSNVTGFYHHLLTEKVEYAKVEDIDFTSARKLMAEMQKSLNDRKSDYGDDASKECTKARSLTQQPDKAKLEHFNLNECKVKPVCLSLVEPYAEAFISKAHGIPTIREFFDGKCMKLTYSDLLR